MVDDIDDIVRCATRCREGLTDADVEQIDTLLTEAGFSDDEYNIARTEQVVSVQFHDLYERRFGEALEGLARETFTFTVHSAFEQPPLVHVR